MKKKEEVKDEVREKVKPEICETCQGTGRHLPEQTCPECKGTGKK